MTALLTDEQIEDAAEEYLTTDEATHAPASEDFAAGARFARSIYEARLAEAISLMKEAAPAIDTISSGLSERFDRFLAVYAKEDKS